MWIRQAGGHVEHESVVELAHLVRELDILAVSLDDNLLSPSRIRCEMRGPEKYVNPCNSL